jgi:hypothetical protein
VLVPTSYTRSRDFEVKGVSFTLTTVMFLVA